MRLFYEQPNANTVVNNGVLYMFLGSNNSIFLVRIISEVSLLFHEYILITIYFARPGRLLESKNNTRRTRTKPLWSSFAKVFHLAFRYTYLRECLWLHSGIESLLATDPAKHS